MRLEFWKKAWVRGTKRGPSSHPDGIEAIRLVRSPRCLCREKEVRLGPVALQHCDVK